MITEDEYHTTGYTNYTDKNEGREGGGGAMEEEPGTSKIVEMPIYVKMGIINMNTDVGTVMLPQ